jgi:hypothetical protein
MEAETSKAGFLLIAAWTNRITSLHRYAEKKT